MRPLPARPAARPLAAAAGALALTWAAWACGGERVAEPAAPRLAELWLEVSERTPARAVTDSMERGEVRSLRAVGRFSDGRIAVVDSAAWAVSDSAVLKNPPTPRAGSIALGSASEGSASVTATAGGLRAELRYTVLRPTVRSVGVRTAAGGPVDGPDSVVVRASRRYRAEVASRAVPLTDRAVAWQSTDTAVATVDADGVVLARAVGTTTLRGTVEGVSGAVTVVVRPPLAARLVFRYAPDTLLARRTDSVRVVLVDSAGQPSAVVPLVRPSTPALQLTSGAVRSTTPGTYELIATGDGLEARRSVVIARVPEGAPTAYPAAVAATAGTSLLLAARASDLDGFAFAGSPQPTYVSADPAVATVSDAGVVTARAPGETSVRVRTGGKQTDVPVAVVAAGAFAMDVRPATAAPLPAPVASAAVEAVGFWQRAILGDLPDVRIDFPANACGTTHPAEELGVDDVLVFASADSIDGPGGVLAQAGPCVYRGSGTAVIGRMQVDSADVARLIATNRLVSVLQHELGHVLGIGTLWSRPSLGFLTRTGVAWRYKGPRAARVGDWWARAVDDEVGGVPLGEGGGHWSELAFGNELMTPAINTGANPVSLITLEALADLGYQTSAAAADPYALYLGTSGTSPVTSRAAAPDAGAAAPFDRVLAPEWLVVGPGRLTLLPR